MLRACLECAKSVRRKKYRIRSNSSDEKNIFYNSVPSNTHFFYFPRVCKILGCRAFSLAQFIQRHFPSRSRHEKQTLLRLV